MIIIEKFRHEYASYPGDEFDADTDKGGAVISDDDFGVDAFGDSGGYDV